MFLTERTLDRVVEQLDYNLDLQSVTTSGEYQVLERENLVDETRDHLYVPNGLVARPCVYKVTKLITHNFDVLKFIDHIIETIPLPFEISLNVGFFIRDMECTEMLTYVKPSTTQSVVTANLTNLEHYWRFRKDIRCTNVDIMRAAFENAYERRQINPDTFPASATILCVYFRKL